MAHAQILRTFHSSMVSFLGELMEQFPEDPMLVLGREYVASFVTPDDLMKNFVQFILPHRDKVLQRDDAFFLHHVHTMFGPSNSHVNHFRTMWLSEDLDYNNRSVIWEWFSSFVQMADQYLYLTRS